MFNNFTNNLNKDVEGYYTTISIQYVVDMKLGDS